MIPRKHYIWKQLVWSQYCGEQIGNFILPISLFSHLGNLCQKVTHFICPFKWAYRFTDNYVESWFFFTVLREKYGLKCNHSDYTSFGKMYFSFSFSNWIPFNLFPMIAFIWNIGSHLRFLHRILFLLYLGGRMSTFILFWYCYPFHFSSNKLPQVIDMWVEYYTNCFYFA